MIPPPMTEEARRQQLYNDARDRVCSVLEMVQNLIDAAAPGELPFTENGSMGLSLLMSACRRTLEDPETAPL